MVIHTTFGRSYPHLYYFWSLFRKKRPPIGWSFLGFVRGFEEGGDSLVRIQGQNKMTNDSQKLTFAQDGTREYIQNLQGTCTKKFTKTGKIEALVEAWNGVGSFCSEKISFTVTKGSGTTTNTTTSTTKPASGDQPTSATISVNKPTVKVEENITLNFSGNGATNTLWVYFPNGTSRYYQNAGTSRTMSFANPGKYEALVETWNAAGTKSFISQKISFTVVSADDSTTTKPITTTNPTTVPIIPTTTTPNTPTTTVPNTPTTVKPNIPSTNQPNAPTVKPSTINPTIPTVVHDCFVNGHGYVNGWCVFCQEKDPSFVAPTTEPAPTSEPIMQSQSTTADNGDNMPNNGGTQVDQDDNGEEFPWILLVLVIFLVCMLGVMIVFLVKKK